MDNAGAGVTYLQGHEAAAFLRNQDAAYRSIIERLGLSSHGGTGK